MKRSDLVQLMAEAMAKTFSDHISAYLQCKPYPGYEIRIYGRAAEAALAACEKHMRPIPENETGFMEWEPELNNEEGGK